MNYMCNPSTDSNFLIVLGLGGLGPCQDEGLGTIQPN